MVRQLTFRCLIFVLIFSFNSIIAQEQPTDQSKGLTKKKQLILGYSYNFGKPNPENYSFASIGFQDINYKMPYGVSTNFSTHFGLNGDSFIFGSSVGGGFYLSIIYFGAEASAYTDFTKYSLRIAPVLGIGTDRFRIVFSPQWLKTNPSLNGVDDLWLSVNYFISLKKG